MTRRNHSIFDVKWITYLSLIFFVMFSTLLMFPLEAAKWGKTNEVVEYKKNRWSGVFINLKGVSYSALIPNFAGSGKKEDIIHISGQVQETFGYLIETSSKSGYTCPKSEKEFIKILKRSYPGYQVKIVPNNVQGAIYVADLTPSGKNEKIHWYCLATKNYLFKMGTDDRSKDNKRFFFQSALIK